MFHNSQERETRNTVLSIVWHTFPGIKRSFQKFLFFFSSSTSLHHYFLVFFVFIFHCFLFLSFPLFFLLWGERKRGGERKVNFVLWDKLQICFNLFRSADITNRQFKFLGIDNYCNIDSKIGRNDMIKKLILDMNLDSLNIVEVWILILKNVEEKMLNLLQ